MKIVGLFFLFIFLTSNVKSQNGLEKIIVEKYYIADNNDCINPIPGGNLPTGSVTYRIFVDMLPGYRFQAAFGIPGHELILSTSTKFFNNEEYGTVSANTIPQRNLKDNTVILDSWISVGAGSEFSMGILKSEDDTLNTIIHKGNYIQNDNKEAGIPVKIRDGLIEGFGQRVTQFGIDSLLDVFNNRTIGSTFSTSNGSWACMTGAIGPDSISNKVLIAQMTTDGDFSFELNIQIGTPDGKYQRYVAKNPTDNEILLPSLLFNSKDSKHKTSKKKNRNT
jgi:hypothetical protein